MRGDRHANGRPLAKFHAGICRAHLTFSVGGPEAMYEREILVSAARQLGIKPNIFENPNERPLGIAISSERTDALYLERARTFFEVGVARTWSKRQ
jgi:hypothetical protein